MKYLQGKFLTGSVTFELHGPKPELMLQQFVNEGIHIWGAKKLSINCCEAKTRKNHLKKMQLILEDHPYEITFKTYDGLPYLIQLLKQNKETFVAYLISFIFFVFLSQFIWSIDINGVSSEVEVKIKSHLEQAKVKQGSFKPFLSSLSDIQQHLLLNIPELLWIGVEQKGTKLQFSGVEKITQDFEAIDHPQHLVANKNGVIEKMHVTKGVPLVAVNDYVTEGKRLVSGDLTDALDEETSEVKQNLVAAEGEVFARTWYEVNVEIPLYVNYEQLAMQQSNKYYLSFGQKQLLIWGFKQPNFTHSLSQSEEFTLDIFNYRLPFKLIQETIYETELLQKERSVEEAITAGISEAKTALALQLDKKANILSHKVLHESTGNGKVKLNLLITVSENIAEEIPITQGD